MLYCLNHQANKIILFSIYVKESQAKLGFCSKGTRGYIKTSFSYKYQDNQVNMAWTIMEVLWSCITGRPALGGSRVDGFSSSGMLAPPYFSWLYQCDWFYYGCHSLKHLSTVKCGKRTKSLACVPFKEHRKLFQWLTMVMSVCLISQGYSWCLGLCLSLAYKQDQYDWLKLIIIYCWSLMGCVLDWRHKEEGRIRRHLPARREEVEKTLW